MKRAIATVLATSLCAVVAAAPADAATKRVAVKDDHFTPKSLTVEKNTRIRWVWQGRSPHNVTVVTGPQRFRSGTKERGARYVKRLRKRGTYRILCTIHPGMEQTIKLR